LAASPGTIVGTSASTSSQVFSLSNAGQNYWIHPAVFTLPAPGTFGSAGQGIIRGPSS
jgi:hypothetical protein